MVARRCSPGFSGQREVDAGLDFVAQERSIEIEVVPPLAENPPAPTRLTGRKNNGL